MDFKGAVCLLLFVVGNFFMTFSTEWIKQNPLPLESQLTPYHFYSYSKAFSVDSLNVCIFGADSIFLCTSDGGKIWTAQSIAGMKSGPAGIKVVSKEKIIAAGQFTWNNTLAGVIFTTNNGGKDWTVILLPVKNEDPSYAYTITNASFTDSANYYLIAYRSLDGSWWNMADFFLKTHDGGKTWSEDSMPANMSSGGSFADNCFIDSSSGWLIRGSSLWSTLNGGKTWQERLLNGYGPNKLCFLGKLNGWVIGGAILHTTDGGQTWKQQMPNYPSQLGIKFTDAMNGWILLSDNRILHTRNGGNKWDYQYTILGYDGQINDFVFANPTCGWIIGNGGLILHTSAAPEPVVDSQYAYKNIEYVFHYPVYFDSLDYTYTLHNGPKDMSISSGGTITWTPSADTFYLQPVELITGDKSGRKDSVTFYISVNNDKKLFTAILANGKNPLHEEGGIAVKSGHHGNGMQFYVPGRISTATIFNLHGRTIATLNAMKTTQTGAEFFWDLRENSGARAGAGMYIIRASEKGRPLTRQFIVAGGRG
jgi:photosystem II stability/assembly factor-like uncharacterized protein